MLVIAMAVTALFGLLTSCKSKQQTLVETDVGMLESVDTTRTQSYAEQRTIERADSFHVVVLSEVWESVNFADSTGGTVVVAPDGAITLHGVGSIVRNGRAHQQVQGGAHTTADSTALHSRVSRGVSERSTNNTQKTVGKALTKADHRYITIGKYASGAVITLVAAVIITFSIWRFGRKIP